jgi:hypothetical protein
MNIKANYLDFVFIWMHFYYFLLFVNILKLNLNWTPLIFKYPNIESLIHF